MDFGAALKQLRKAKGMTQSQLAEKAGLSYSAIVSYENGRRKEVQYNILFKLASALNVRPEDLIPDIYGQLHEAATEAIAEEKKRQLDWVIERFNMNDEDLILLIDSFMELNEKGKQEAVSRINELLYVPAYYKKLEG